MRGKLVMAAAAGLVALGMAAGARAQAVWPASVLRLEDVLAGGDGTGTAPAGIAGIDPATGDLVSDGADGQILDTDGVNPQPVPGNPFVDSVFLLGPAATVNEVPLPLIQALTQSGVTEVFPHDDGVFQGFGAIVRDRPGGSPAAGIRVGGIDTFSTAIGIHSSAGVTFDLDALRAAHGADAVGCFSAFWGLDACAGGLARFHAILSDDGGVLDHRSSLLGADEGESIQMAIPPGARYLTLACGSAGDYLCDEGAFARPLIVPASCPPTTREWIWSVSPAAIPAFAPAAFLVEGEGFREDESIQVGGLNLDDTTFLSARELAGTIPPVPPGYDDVDVVKRGTGELMARLPNGVLAIAPPAVDSVDPPAVLSGRDTPVSIRGSGFTATTAISIEEAGEGGAPAPLGSPVLVSDTLIQGVAPALGAGAAPGSKTLLQDGNTSLEFPGLIAYVDVGIERVDPREVPVEGGAAVTFVGQGFTADLVPRLGGQPLADVALVDESHLSGISPPLGEGLHEATVETAGGDILFTLQDAVAAVAAGDLRIAGVDPPVVSSLGGDAAIIATSRIAAGALPRIGGLPLVNPSAPDGLTLAGEAPPLPPGRYAVDLIDANGTVLASLEDAVESADPGGVALSGIDPARVSTLGGAPVEIAGSGFTEELRPRVGGLPVEDVVVVSASLLRGTLPPLEAGVHDVTLEGARLVRARLAGTVTAVAPDPILGGLLGHVSPARIPSDGGTRVRFVGAGLPPDALPRIGGRILDSVERPDACHASGLAPALSPGFYLADLFRPGFGVVASLDEPVEVTAPGIAARITHVVSSAVLTDGSTRLWVYGQGFRPDSEVLVGGRPLLDPAFVSDELVVGNAPPLASGESPGIRDLLVRDDRGGAIFPSAVRYVESGPTAGGAVSFRRGDVNQDGRTDISDTVATLGFLFQGSPSRLDCPASADVDSSGRIDITDAIGLLGYLFLGGPPPGQPFGACGPDPGQGGLPCESFAPCGGATVLQDTLYVVPGAPRDPGDPRVLDVSAEGNEVLVADPPGGRDLQAGDVIAGFVPLTSDAIRNGPAYLLRLVEPIDGTCLPAVAGARAFRTAPAGLADAFRSLELHQLDLEFLGGRDGRLAEISGKKQASCLALQRAGGGGAGGDDQLVDVEVYDFPSLDLFRDGDDYIQAGFRHLKVRYNPPTGINMGLGVKVSGFPFPEAEITRLTVFMGPLLEAEFLAYLEANYFDERTFDKVVFRKENPKLVFIEGVPILNAIAELKAGVHLKASAHLDFELGAQARFKAGYGYELSGGGLKNISGFDPPSVDILPGTPKLEVDGSIAVTPFLRPKVTLFAGLLIHGLTATLDFDSEAYVRLHADGSNHPVPCIRWGVDPGLTADARVRFAFVGIDFLDKSVPLLREEKTGFISGEIGCHFPPVAVIRYAREVHGTDVTVHLDASASSDPAGGPLTFWWDLDGDGKCDQYTGQDPHVTLHLGACPSQAGCYRTVRLQVRDHEGEKAEASALLRF